MNKKRICPICGKEFTAKSNASKYCSEICRRKANVPSLKDKNRTFSCAWCGEEFVFPRQKKYCSYECRMHSYGRLNQNGLNITKPSLSLEQVALLSRSAGISYGQYVQLYGLN